MTDPTAVVAGLSPVDAALVLGHVLVFLGTLRIAYTSYRAYQTTEDALHRNLAVGFVVLVVGLTLDDLLTTTTEIGHYPSEVVELVPTLIAIALIYYALFHSS